MKRPKLKGVNLVAKDLSIADTSGEIIKNVSFTGSFDCREVLRKDLKVENIKGPVEAGKGIYSFKPLTMDALGGKGEGDLTADMSGADARYEVNLKVSKLDFEKLEESFGIKKVIGGKGDLSASLTVKEKGRRILMSNLNGTFALRGDNLVSYTMDLDKVLSTFESSQTFHLVDLAGYLLRRTSQYRRAQGIPLWETLLRDPGRNGHHHQICIPLEDRKRRGRRDGLRPCDAP